MIVEVLRKRTDIVNVLPLLVVALLMGTASAYNLTCHCLSGSTCDANGYCPNGCDKGWSGPGCQVGNVALKKTAQQSTNYTDPTSKIVLNPANSAVDGTVPNSDSAEYCSHTGTVETANGSAWWFVTLDVTYCYVISNITLVNRRSPNSNRLSNFTILYSNETESNPDPSNSTWCNYAEENGTVGNNKTYTSNSAVIAKRVAVYLRASSGNPGAILTLCEVVIYGYEYHDCPRGFTGPGCLLLSCDQCGSSVHPCNEEFDSCHYEVCPDQSLLPPDCWITVSNIATLNVSSTAACNNVLFSVALPDTKPKPNIAATSLQLQVTTYHDQMLLENATLSLEGNNSATYKFSGAVANTSYKVSVKFQYCNVLGRSCFLSTGSQVLTVKTGVRQYFYSHNTSCVNVSANSTTLECEPFSSIQITCESKAVGGVTVNSSNSPLCGLEHGMVYNCSVAAIVNAKTIERQSVYIGTELLDTPSIPNDNILAGSIGGTIFIIVFVVAIIVVVYCRQKQKTRLHMSVVKLDTKGNDPDIASTLDLPGLPSLRTEQYDNPYESLHKDLNLQSTGDYASL